MFKSVMKLALTTACATAMTFGAAQAQTSAPVERQATPPAEQQVQITPEQIDSYVEARTQIDSLANEYRAKFQNVTDPEQGRAIQAEMNAEMATVVESEGLTVQEYNMIAMAAQQNPELQQQVESKMMVE